MTRFLSLSCGAVLLLLLLLPSVFVDGRTVDGRSSTGVNKLKPKLPPRATPLNVHVVPHSHNDVGWLKTAEQYYWGSNATIDSGAVQYIFDTVVEALVANPSRKFIFVEMAFFQKWYLQQAPELQSTVKSLVSEGRIEFINAGWCMHDEATTHYIEMIDQMSLGHTWLAKEFGVFPKVAWQIDPFGHSATQGALFSSQAGFEALYMKRIDMQDLAERQSARTTELIWQPSPSLGASAQVFTGVLYWGYSAPDGFCFDERCEDPAIVDDPNANGYNLPERVETYVQSILAQAETMIGQDVMIMAGDDFNYMNAHQYYKNLEKLMKAVNQDGRLNMFYSTPSLYTEAKNAHQASEGLTFPTKHDDFFPYSNDVHAYWSGFYTSRPSLKRQARVTSGVFQSLRLLEFMTGARDTEGVLLALREALGVVQHHDAITGTSMQHVAFDYERQLASGRVAAEQRAASQLLTQVYALPNGAKVPEGFRSCALLNVSVCEVTQGMTTNGAVISIFNPLFRSRTELVTIPLPTCSQANTVEWQVLDSALGSVTSQVVTLSTDGPARVTESANCAISFLAKLPPASGKLYFIQGQQQQQQSQQTRRHSPPHRSLRSSLSLRRVHPIHLTEDDIIKSRPVPVSVSEAPPQPLSNPADAISIANEYYTLNFDASSGLLTTIQPAGSAVLDFKQEFFYYSSFQDSTMEKGDHQNSGAYIFRPNSTTGTLLTPVNLNGAVKTRVLNQGPIVKEVAQIFAPWLSQVIRLTSGSSEIEFEWSIGPIPIEDGVGKEVITRYSTSIASNATWYTDSNGREMQRRQRFVRPTYKLNITEPVAGEYYPVNVATSIADASTQLTVVVDRSEGCTSLNDGELELMLHRRLLFDDLRGVREPLNETARISGYPNPIHSGEGLVVTGKHRILLTPLSNAARSWRDTATRAYSEPWFMFGDLKQIGVTPEQWTKAYATQTQTVTKVELPNNLEVITIETNPADLQMTVRLAHTFGVGEDATLSQPASVDLAQLFASVPIMSMSQLTLTANRPMADLPPPLAWNTKDHTAQLLTNSSAALLIERRGTVVILAPMQIATFNFTL